MRALEFDRLMALLLRVFRRSASVTRPSLSCIEVKTDLFTLQVTFNTVGIISH